MLIILDAISIEENLFNKINVKVNFCDKAKLIKTNNICCENDERDYVLIEKTKKKVLKNSLRSFDYLTDSRNHAIINKIKNDYIKKKKS